MERLSAEGKFFHGAASSVSTAPPPSPVGLRSPSRMVSSQPQVPGQAPHSTLHAQKLFSFCLSGAFPPRPESPASVVDDRGGERAHLIYLNACLSFQNTCSPTSWQDLKVERGPRRISLFIFALEKKNHSPKTPRFLPEVSGSYDKLVLGHTVLRLWLPKVPELCACSPFSLASASLWN